MTPTQRIVAREVRRADGWLASCSTQVDVAEQRLRAAIMQRETGIEPIRNHLAGLKGQRERAAEDLVGWQRLSRKLR